jgi:SnoaL-like domain
LVTTRYLTLGPSDQAWAQDFAKEWIAAWNSHDLDLILSHYVEDFEMSSPLIIERKIHPSGVLRGKAAIRKYWAIGLAAVPPIQFELIDVHVGVNTIGILYRSIGRCLDASVRIAVLEPLRAVNAALLELLDGFGADDWNRPTIHKDRSVKDLTAHLLHGSIRRVSGMRDAYWAPASVRSCTARTRARNVRPRAAIRVPRTARAEWHDDFDLG